LQKVIEKCFQGIRLEFAMALVQLFGLGTVEFAIPITGLSLFLLGFIPAQACL
jgi:hypothetical protein